DDELLVVFPVPAVVVPDAPPVVDLVLDRDRPCALRTAERTARRRISRRPEVAPAARPQDGCPETSGDGQQILGQVGAGPFRGGRWLHAGRWLDGGWWLVKG